MQRLQPCRNKLDDLVHEIADGFCEILCDRPIFCVPVEIYTTKPKSTAQCLLQFEQSRNVETGIGWLSIDTIRKHLKMTMRSRRIARAPRFCDEHSLRYILPHADQKLLIMPIKSIERPSMIDHDGVSIALHPARITHRA